MSENINLNKDLEPIKKELVICSTCNQLVENYFQMMDKKGYRKTYCPNHFICSAFADSRESFGKVNDILTDIEGKLFYLNNVISLLCLVSLGVIAIKTYLFFMR